MSAKDSLQMIYILRYYKIILSKELNTVSTVDPYFIYIS